MYEFTYDFFIKHRVFNFRSFLIYLFYVCRYVFLMESLTSRFLEFSKYFQEEEKRLHIDLKRERKNSLLNCLFYFCLFLVKTCN